MAIVPLKQTVTISRVTSEDEWGREVRTEFTMKCRFEEGTRLARGTTRGNSKQSGVSRVTVEEILSVAKIIFDKNADIRHDDEITYIDENGIAQTYTPINIRKIRGLNGKAMLTEVSV